MLIVKENFLTSHLDKYCFPNETEILSSGKCSGPRTSLIAKTKNLCYKYFIIKKIISLKKHS